MSAAARTKDAEPAYQATDAPARAPLIAIACVFGLILVVGAAAAGLLALFEGRAPPSRATAVEAARQEPPAPRLEPDPNADLARVEAAARSHLSGYGWSDRAAGLARIPIERAMTLQAAAGWPDGPMEPQP